MVILGLALVVGACSGTGGGQLLVAEDTAAEGGSGATKVWAVDPGDDLSADALVAEDAAEPLGVATIDADGLSWFNQLGRTWQGDALLAYSTADSSRVTAGRPGDTATEVATSDGPLQAVVLRRGVAVVSQEGCSLATGAEEATEIGTGACQVSEDERWVASWPQTPGPLTIRDLRDDSTRTVKDIKTVSAAPLGRDARVLAVEQTDDGVRGRLIDATDGSTIATTDTFDAMQPAPATDGATGFVAIAQSGGEGRLLWIATDGTVSVIDTGPALVPVAVTSEVTYLRLDQSEDDDSLRRWTPGGDDGEREVLLTGRVGAAAATMESIVATRETDDGVEFYRSAGTGALDRVLTLDTDTSQGVLVNKMLVHDGMAFLEVQGAAATSFVRLDLHGDDSDAPATDRPYLVLESVDTDGTVLLTASEGQDQEEQLLVVGPRDDTARVRARAASTGTNLIHEGVVYYTAVDADGAASVRSVRAAGDKDPEVLYQDHQIAGATWPEDGGATQSLLVSRTLLLSSQGQGAGQ